MLDDKIKAVSVDRLISAPKLQAETSVVSLARQMSAARRCYANCPAGNEKKSSSYLPYMSSR